MKTFISWLLTVALIAAMSGGCVITSDSSLTIANESSYAIVEINVAPVSSSTWGPDLLGPEWLYPGEEITIDFIDCDYYVVPEKVSFQPEAGRDLA